MRLVRALALVLVGLLWLSAPAWGDPRTGGTSGGSAVHHHGAHHGVHHGGIHGRHHHRFPGSTLFFPFGFFPGPVYPDPFYASAPPAYAYAPPPPPPLVRVIYYSTGRYVLYGDGMTAPYQWVWIPNAPPPPPPPPGVPPPPPSAPPSVTPEPSQQVPSAPRELWSWTDEQGTAHWTDLRDNIPERYRAIAQRRG